MEVIKLENADSFVQECIDSCKIDIDSNFCDKTEFKFDNHEVNADEIDLLQSKTNIKAFKFVFPDAKID